MQHELYHIPHTFIFPKQFVILPDHFLIIKYEQEFGYGTENGDIGICHA